MDLEVAKRVALNLLGNCYLGSKSTAHKIYPDKDLVFNGQVWAMERGCGHLHHIHTCDLILNDQAILLEELASQLKTEIYIYRESTVNNQVFNGRVFPYERYDYAIRQNRGGSYEFEKIGNL
jgi:hypothetical protein